ncbi:hypothetical protein MARINON1_51766 [Marinobacter salarius]|nr:hypothetical protein MBHK15_110977 [Marinobacter salarius]VXB97666.1 hypothetical protein MARINON1_51766 [Marinobacter salarius]
MGSTRKQGEHNEEAFDDKRISSRNSGFWFRIGNGQHESRGLGRQSVSCGRHRHCQKSRCRGKWLARSASHG